MKLHAESREILAEAIAAIAAERPDFLLVCGDLTRDGERSAHELAAAMLGELDDAGVPVLVVPGNHDVLNPAAARFADERVEPVAGVTPGKFAAIYAGLGYAEALERDPASLSYVAEPVPGLRVLALDACRYDGEPGSPRTDGRLSRATRAWAARVLARARADGAAVIAFLHHAVVPHFTGHGAMARSRTCSKATTPQRACWPARVCASSSRDTGTPRTSSGETTREGPVWDVETGSLVSWPNPWRLVEIGPGGAVRISSRRVTAIPSLGETFAFVCGVPPCRRIVGWSHRRPGSQRCPRRAGGRHRSPGGRGRFGVLRGRRARAGRTGRPFGAGPLVLPRRVGHAGVL